MKAETKCQFSGNSLGDVHIEMPIPNMSSIEYILQLHFFTVTLGLT
jgi:hypothetical protein